MHVILLILILQSNAMADIFQSDKTDHDLTSALGDPYAYKKSVVKPLMTWSIDPDLEIKKSIDDLSATTHRQNLKSSDLLLWEYGAPAEADVFKHFQTLSYLRFNTTYDRLKDLEDNNRHDLNMLRKEAIYNCVQEKFFRGTYKNDLDSLLKSCQANAAFKDFEYVNAPNLFEKLFNLFNLRGAKKENILSILPVWRVESGAIFLVGPSKRIGHVLKAYKDTNITTINNALSTYQHQKTVATDLLESLSQPNRPFTSVDFIFLLTLNDADRLNHVQAIASQRAISQAIDQYNEALEWLNRYKDHPILEDAYKNIIQKGITYLQQEKDSLTDKLKDISDYAIVIDHMLNQAKEEQLRTLEESKAQERFKAMGGL